MLASPNFFWDMIIKGYWHIGLWHIFVMKKTSTAVSETGLTCMWISAEVRVTGSSRTSYHWTWPSQVNTGILLLRGRLWQTLSRELSVYNLSHLLNYYTNNNSDYLWHNSNKEEHSESANLRQRQNLKQKWSGIRIRIFGLIRIRMSVGFVPKCCGCTILSSSVISPSTWYKSAVGCMRNANKCPKIPYSAMVKQIKK